MGQSRAGSQNAAVVFWDPVRKCMSELILAHTIH